jgi:hypothetical protein
MQDGHSWANCVLIDFPNHLSDGSDLSDG